MPQSQYPITWITNSLAVGYAPMSYAELESIKNDGIDAIVNLCAEFSDLHELEKSVGFEVYYLPIWDEDIPKIQDMEEALAWLDEALYLGKKVLVHCRHGIGRTGTFVTSYMIRKGLGLKAAKKKLKTSMATPSSYGQWKLLKKYGKKSGILKIREPSLEVKNRVDLSLFFSDYEFLIKDIDKKISHHTKDGKGNTQCGKAMHKCCSEFFEIQFIEVVYIHSKINRQFTSAERETLIKNTFESSRHPTWTSFLKKSMQCPFNNGSGCKIYGIRPARCRTYGIAALLADQNEIMDMLFQLSGSVFLAFSGKFLLHTDFKFSMAETISGKFVQKYFHYMAGIEKHNSSKSLQNTGSINVGHQ